jgi:ABC-2 type transport system permease protein
LNFSDSIISKVLTFLPISSYSTMFMRIAMGNAAPWEVILSFVILVVSIIGAGFLGAKIYRMGTLRYGNPIKFSTAIKSLRHSE